MASTASPRKQNGVLAVNTAQTQSPASAPDAAAPSKSGRARTPASGKKVAIRRLPPALTADEFWAVLGDSWKPGAGKVDWHSYCDGQVSTDPSFPSYPARAYLRITKLEDLPLLSDHVQKSTWEDAKHTFNDPALVGPPYVEIHSFQKVPTSKRRTDPRQGTIDQDPEYQAFLQSLTEPILPKDPDADQLLDDAAASEAKATITPLVQYLKEKKANKAKEAATAKSAKHGRHESQAGKGKEPAEPAKKKGKDSKSDRAADSNKEKEKDKDSKDKEREKEKGKPKEPIKLLTKKAAAQQEATEAANKAAATQAAAASKSAAAKLAEEAAPKSRRANIAAAAKILQRDLGLSPGSAHRRARQDAAKADPTTKSDSSKDAPKEKKKIEAAPATPEPAASVPVQVPAPSSKSQAAEPSRKSRNNKAAKPNSVNEGGKGKAPETTPNAAKSAPPVAPVILKRKDDTAAPAASTSTATPAPSSTPSASKAASGKSAGSGRQGAPGLQKKGSNQPPVATGATRGFIKHANPSQGVTEALLRQAMETFGKVAHVELDKKKGFAYIEFSDHDGLAKAIAASPVTVAQAALQVLERKETKKPAPTPPAAPATTPAAPAQPTGEKQNKEPAAERPKRGGRGRGRRGAGNASKQR